MPERISSKERRDAFFFILKFGLKGTPLTINRPQMRPQNGGCMESEEKRTKNGDSMQKYCFLQLL